MFNSAFKQPEILLYLTVLIIFLSIILYNIGDFDKEMLNEYKCNLTQKASEMYFSGIAVEKYRDNQGKTILKIIGDDRENEVDFSHEKSDFYDNIVIGDSISKIENTLEVRIWRNKVLFSNTLYYGCINDVTPSENY